ncbi:hypothetical protein HanIR_Chr08g0376311 [Helianthus annuus]|nr:hypothetical protein HanIR_Chr08g0376311 [Helianthus annuus]
MTVDKRICCLMNYNIVMRRDIHEIWIKGSRIRKEKITECMT